MVDPLFIFFWDTAILISLGALQFALPPATNIIPFSLHPLQNLLSFVLLILAILMGAEIKSQSSFNLLSVAAVGPLMETLLYLLFLENLGGQHCQVLLPTQDVAWPITKAWVASVWPGSCFWAGKPFSSILYLGLYFPHTMYFGMAWPLSSQQM